MNTVEFAIIIDQDETASSGSTPLYSYKSHYELGQNFFKILKTEILSSAFWRFKGLLCC